MTTPWIHPDVRLRDGLARTLYHEVAADLPIIDYHCHLNPADVAADRSFDSMAELWLLSDPYKHRAMRIAGVPEREITGDAPPDLKFRRWAETLPQTAGNPLHFWSALELKRFFDIDTPLTPDTADDILHRTESRLSESTHTARGLLKQCRVECVCTSDRLLDDLQHHRAMAESDAPLRMLPSLRGDDIIALDPEWLVELAGDDTSFDGFLQAVTSRLNAFDQLGCRLADHALDTVRHERVDPDHTGELYEVYRAGRPLKTEELERLRGGVLRMLANRYAELGWTLQLHIGARRDTSSRLKRLAGPAGGYACLGSPVSVADLTTFLDDVQTNGPLPRIILYNLNPADNAAMATLTGSFHNDGMPGTVQWGPAWWYNDHRVGMEAHLDTLSAHGLLPLFVGMTTDSRSLLSMTRHEMFRRVLCAWLSRRVEEGDLPRDLDLLSTLVRRVCVENARDFILSPHSHD